MSSGTEFRFYHDPRQPGRWAEITDQEEIQNLQRGMDFRLPQYRREVFLKFYQFHLKHNAHPGCVYFLLPYLAKEFSWGLEEKLWFAFLNGNTQNPITSWLIFQRFPSIGELSLRQLDSWFRREYGRLGFDLDRRHHKTHFLAAVENYQQLLTGFSQESYFSQFVETGRFLDTWGVVTGCFDYFGRLSAFSYLEYLRLTGLPISCDTLFLEDIQGSRSHRNGLAKVLGRDDLDWHESNPINFQGNYSKKVLLWLKEEAQFLLREAQERFQDQKFSQDTHYFTLESALCTYKSWHRPNRRYPGCYLDMLHDRIKRAEAAWPKEDFFLFWKARRECLPEYLLLEKNPLDPGLCPEKQNHYLSTGQVIMMDKDFPVFKNDFNDKVQGRSVCYKF